MDEKVRLIKALNSSDPYAAVYELAVELKTEGMGQVQMYKLFVEFQQNLDGNDPKYNAVVDTMDLIWGGPWAKGRDLFDKVLSEENIK